MPAAHECARKILVFVITFIQFLCKHKFDIFLVWGAGVRRSCKSMASSCLESPLEENTVIRSPHKDKDSREEFEMRTHKRLIDILDPSSSTVDSLMRMDLPAGVDIDIKL